MDGTGLRPLAEDMDGEDMDVIAGLYQEWANLLAPHPLLRALEWVVIFLLLAALLDRLITGLVHRLASRTETDLDDRIAALLHRPLFSSVAIIGVLVGIYELDLDPEFLLVTGATVQTLLILIWVYFGLRFTRLLLQAMGRHPERFEMVQVTTEPLLRNAVSVVLLVAGAYGILLAWDLNVTGLVASAGIVGLALSFAAQDTLSNLFAGVAILTDRPYKLGDYIILDSGERGKVTQIGLRSTRLLTRDDVEISIPNGVMGRAKIVNEAQGVPHQYRIRVKVGVAYGSDIDEVMKTLLEVAGAHDKVLATPEARARFREFGDSSLNFELLCWITQPGQRGLVVHELNCAVYKAFGEAGIQIPFPQRDLYIKEMPGTGT